MGFDIYGRTENQKTRLDQYLAQLQIFVQVAHYPPTPQYTTTPQPPSPPPRSSPLRPKQSTNHPPLHPHSVLEFGDRYFVVVNDDLF